MKIIMKLKMNKIMKNALPQLKGQLKSKFKSLMLSLKQEKSKLIKPSLTNKNKSALQDKKRSK